MELLQRDLQRVMLFQISEAYPDSLGIQRKDFGGYEPRQITYNLGYLEEHGLVKVIWAAPINSPKTPLRATITAKGIDFITNDGGLSAVLGVVTVKLHQDTIKELLIKKVQSSEGDETIKAKLIDQIKGMPAEATQQLASRALEAGVEHLPNAVHWLRTVLGF